MGRQSKWKMLQSHKNDCGSKLLGIRLQEKHNENNWRCFQRIKVSYNIFEHHPTLTLPKRCSHINLQETMEPFDTRTNSQPQQLCRLYTLVFAWTSRYMERTLIFRTFFSLTRPNGIFLYFWLHIFCTYIIKRKIIGNKRSYIHKIV